MNPQTTDAPGAGSRARLWPSNLSQLGNLAGYLRPYKAQVALALGMLVASVALELGIGQAVSSLVDHGSSAEKASSLDRSFLVVAGIVVALAITTACRSYFLAWVGERVTADLRARLYHHVVGLTPAFFETMRTGDVLSRLTSDTAVIQSVVGLAAPMGLRGSLLLAGGTVLLFVSGPKLALMIMALVPFAVLPVVVFGRRVQRLARVSQDRLADACALGSEGLNAIQTVQAFTHEDADRRAMAGRVEQSFLAAVSRSRAHATLVGAVVLVVFLSVTGVLWLGAKDVMAGRMTVGQLTAFVFYAVIVATSFGNLSEIWAQIQNAAGAAQRIWELLLTKPEICAPPFPVRLPEPSEGAVCFENVTFFYPSRPDVPALDKFSLEVAPGETVALVGPSGAGKSTVFNLLLRFYDPQAGRVLLDGVDVSAADPSAVRARISLVAQDPVVFSGTVAENIRYGRPDASDDEVRAAAVTAAAHEFTQALPQGYATYLGERGVRLSAGQRQRLAIARAVVRHSSVLLFDEATSALDSESERLVQQALGRVAGDRTTIVIAHRLATVLKADRIVVMDRGQVVAVGTHQELMEQDGLYARLARLQFETGAEALQPQPDPVRG